jgi:hypothetical protein
MTALQNIRRVVSVLVYFIAISLGAGVFVANPPRVLLMVPILTSCLLLGHAVKTNHLEELGYATMWLWAALLFLQVSLQLGWLIWGTILVHREISPLVGFPEIRFLGTIWLLAVLLTSYIRGVQGGGSTPILTPW